MHELSLIAGTEKCPHATDCSCNRRDVKYARGEDGGRDYFLYVPPGGGKKLRSLMEVQTYLDAPVEYSRTSPGLARPLPVVTGPGGEKRSGRVRTKSIMTMDATKTRPGGGALMYS